MPYFTHDQDMRVYSCFPLNFKYPTTSEVFIALQAFIILYLIQRCEAGCMKEVECDIWVAI